MTPADMTTGLEPPRDAAQGPVDAGPDRPAGTAAPALGRAPVSGQRSEGPAERLRWAISDTATITWRNLVRYTRIPQMLVFSSIQPIMFVLLFRYVFGGAIPTPGMTYVQYLIPGIFVQTVCFGAINTGVGLAEDLGKGLIERFRSLPMSPAAVLAGRTTADLCRNVFVVVIMTVVGVAVGFRSSTGPLSFLAGVALLLLFAYALSWLFAIIGLAARNAEVAQAMAFPILFPITFASTAFVPARSMPGWLQVWAVHQPVSIVIDAVRAFFVTGASTGPWPAAFAWTLGMLVVFYTLAVHRYRKVV